MSIVGKPYQGRVPGNAQEDELLGGDLGRVGNVYVAPIWAAYKIAFELRPTGRVRRPRLHLLPVLTAALPRFTAQVHCAIFNASCPSMKKL